MKRERVVRLDLPATWCQGWRRDEIKLIRKEGPVQQLTERGVYTLPSERGELVAHAVFRGGYVLYTPTDWEFFGPYTYESDRAGNIRREGESTFWHIHDLAYTNRTARSRSRSGAAQKPIMFE
jgi:hypothetical protein